MDKAINVTDVSPENIDRIWPMVRDKLANAIQHNQGEHELPDLHVNLLVGRMKLWVSYDEEGNVRSCAIVELRRELHRLVCFILYAAGGDLHDWELGSECIEGWAFEMGADVMQAYARPGVERRFKNNGYQKVYTVVQKDLTQRRLH